MNTLIPEWPRIPDKFGVLPRGYELRYSAELDVLAIWCPEEEKHVALPAGRGNKGALEYAVAVLEMACYTGWIN